MTNVLTLYQSLNPSGTVIHKGGGEYCGPCPRCGGKDRFVLWPDHPSGAVGGRFLCRGCGAQGDAIEFLRAFRGLGYREACEELRVEPRRNEPHIRNSTAREEWTPEPERLPSAGWSERAAEFVAECASGIESGPGLEYLRSRSLTVETAHRLGIGWNAADRYDSRTAWGLPEETNPETGKPRKIWLPRGLVLPIRRRSGVAAVLIRRADWKPEDRFPKYWQVKGSGNGCCCVGAAGRPVVLLESILDAVLAWQEAGDVAAAVALTGATKHPDAATAAFLKAAPTILWSLDYDRAGTDALPWWLEHFPNVKVWPCASGKDVGEMAAAGVPVRAWVQAGLEAVEQDARHDDEHISLPGDDAAPASVLSDDTLSHEQTPMPEPERSQKGQCAATEGPQVSDFLRRLAEVDSNVACLVGWGFPPRLEGGRLILDGLDAETPEIQAAVGRYLDHRDIHGEPRRERVIRALKTGRRAAWIC